ncbi:vWA domain-containing protein [Rhizohabitans arisaemae]|uniref:vWA domain-containing protein n=1 Tax=Rhizohabitans arisaemae TaxID=2720610 RepID=UPI0024B04547|nr:VWA domain-containing protein [Rhizohabitans arisaemae]
MTDTIVGFARTLRAAGVDADHERTRLMIRALGHVSAANRDEVYWAGRVTLCSTPDDLPRYDRCFAAYFAGETPRLARSAPPVVIVRHTATPVGEPGEQEEGESGLTPAGVSEVEVLRTRDVAGLTAAERDEVHRLLGMLRAGRMSRVSRRFLPARRGRLDQRRTVRAMLRQGGEIGVLHRRRHRRRPRRVVLLIDVSGSMAAYADTLLRLAHALVRSEPRATEVFTLGTRLTRVTAELRHRDPATAMTAVSAAIPDWSGGTRLGAELKEFLTGSRARGAIVVIASDGWERGDASLLGDQMARLSRLAHQVIWVNPHKGRIGYEPLTAGMRVSLPHVDEFIAGHSLAAYERLARLLAGG